MSSLLTALKQHMLPCILAQDYLLAYAAGDAIKAWQDCDRIDWMMWFLERANLEAATGLLFLLQEEAPELYKCLSEGIDDDFSCSAEEHLADPKTGTLGAMMTDYKLEEHEVFRQALLKT